TVASTKVTEASNRRRKLSPRFRCFVCHADFTAKHNLQFHENSHKGKKPYTCRYCGSSFTVPRSRVRHERKCKQS
ncbi:hypothetical protein F5876DRAFT_9677, partial [Lentinula aff. lateritia]